MYYEWQQFGVSPAPGPDDDTIHDVAIIGGGPVGLALALALRQQGTNVVLVEARTQISDGSRALTLNRESLAFLDTIGVSDDFMKLAQPRQRNVVFQGTEELWRTEYSLEQGERWPTLALLQQCWLEDILVAKLRQEAPDALRWGHAVTDVTDVGDAVVLDVDADGATYRLKARYVIGTDGARGTTRRSLGLEYHDVIPRRGADTNFIICDFSMDHDLPPGRRLFIGPDYAPDSVAILHSQPFDVWRLDYQIPDGLTPEEAATPEAGEARVRQHLAMMGIDAAPKIHWVTTYRALGRSLSAYRHGRVLFAGDSAHQSPIFGGRGLNMGLGDVNALAWRLPLALAGGTQHLDDYSQERTFVVKRTLQALTPVCLFMTSAEESSKLLRREIMSLLPEMPGLRELIDGHAAAQISQFPLGPNAAGVRGEPLRELRVATESHEVRFLSELLPGGHFSLKRLSGAGAGDGSIALQLRSEEPFPNAGEIAGEGSMQVLWATNEDLCDRLALRSEGDVLWGRPDRVVYSENLAAKIAVDNDPQTDLQRLFVELSSSLLSPEGRQLDATAIRESLREAALEGTSL